MVVKMNTPPRQRSESESPVSSSSSDDDNTSASSMPDPLRGVQSAGVGKKSKAASTELEFSRLKNLVPAISKKSTVSKLDVILEAIRYIDQLQDQLLDQIQEQRLHPQAAADLLVGKENTNTELLERLHNERNNRQ